MYIKIKLKLLSYVLHTSISIFLIVCYCLNPVKCYLPSQILTEQKLMGHTYFGEITLTVTSVCM